MVFRRLLYFLLPFFACALFWQPLSEWGIGLAARLFFRLQEGWDFDYCSVAWKKGKCTFSGVSLSSKGVFYLSAEEMGVSLGGKHISLEHPHIDLLEVPSMKSGGGWMFTAREGVLEGPGIEKCRFKARRCFPGQVAQLFLDWGESQLMAEIVREGEGLQLNAELEKFDPYLLRRWLGSDVRGALQGRVHLTSSKGINWTKAALHLKGEEMSWKEIVRGIAGSFDWEGGCTLHSFFREGRFRFAIEKGEIARPGGRIKEICGEGSFIGGMGAKWEWRGRGASREREFDIAWKGRGFFSSRQQPWLESDLFLGEMAASLRGREEGKWVWEGECRKAGAEQITLLQSIASLFNPSIAEWEMAEGVLEMKAKAADSFWEVCSFALQDVAGKGKGWEASAHYLSGSYSSSSGKGELTLKRGAGRIPFFGSAELCASEWSGQLHLEGEEGFSSHFEGKVGDALLIARAEGALRSFSAHAEVAGPWNAQAALKGNWDGEKLFFSIGEGEVEGVHFTAKGWVDSDLKFFASAPEFEGPLAIFRNLPGVEGRLESSGNGLIVKGGKENWDWSLQARIEEGAFPLFSRARLEHIEMELEADPHGFSCFEVRGAVAMGIALPLYCPVVKSEGPFDIRIEGLTWDLVRLSGILKKGEAALDLKTSHFFGAPFTRGEGCFGREGCKELQFLFYLPWESAVSAFSHLPISPKWAHLPIKGGAEVALHYDRGGGSELRIDGAHLEWKREPIPFSLHAVEEEKKWAIRHFQCSSLSLSAEVFPEEEALRFAKGRGKKGEGIEFDFEGRIDPHRSEIHLPRLKVELSAVLPRQVRGNLEGMGHLIWDGAFESDFDFAPSSFETGPFCVESQGPFHAYYSFEKGALFRGLDLSIYRSDREGAIGCKIDLLQCDPSRFFWSFHRSHLHVPRDFLADLKEFVPFLKGIEPTHDIDLTADLRCTSDLSSISCSMKEGVFPFAGAMRHLQDVSFSLEEGRVFSDFSYFHQGHLLQMGLRIDLGPPTRGRLTLLNEEEKPMVIDWDYEKGKGVFVHSIEGTFGGVEALFHSEGEGKGLIGSARLDFSLLSEYVSPRIARVFRELKMGKGYEMKGRLFLEPEGISFRGLLSGKQLELFGYQLRTLLGQIEFTPEHVSLCDLKISDLAGMMKIETIRAQGKGEEPWILSIPHLVITEFRPSLLQRIGQPPGSISPLVVRELKMEDFKGDLENSQTYTAKGELRFINSYKREYTVFDLPSDVLSRIVGLDLELLIPVCGSFKYELKDRLFRLTELRGAYSEGKRSEFFLIEEGDTPFMDLDGNLRILVKMKQFVLFKITESFLISIEGTLDDPKYHLQKRKGFLGL